MNKYSREEHYAGGVNQEVLMDVLFFTIGAIFEDKLQSFNGHVSSLQGVSVKISAH